MKLKCNLLKQKSSYKPFHYPWAYDFFLQHERMHWLAEEVPLETDLKDWKNKLTVGEKELLTQLFRFFTQADVDVAAGYAKKYLPNMSFHPEITMMMNSFAGREGVHIDAYSKLIETLNMPDSLYQEFLDYAEMKDKHEFVNEFNITDPYSILLGLAIYSGFTEGMQLFSSFAILMNFERFNKMKGMCNIVRWSIRDETIHVQGMTTLFKTLLQELGLSESEKQKLRLEIIEIVSQMIYLEDRFIDLCFASGDVEGLTKNEIKSYIRYIANRRFNQLGFLGDIYVENTQNPLPWLDWVINGKEHANFFEARATDYSKGTLTESANIEW